MNLFTAKDFFLGMLAVFIGVVVYAFLDWDRFYNRYLVKEEEIKQGYFYLINEEQFWLKVRLVSSEKRIDAWYQQEGESVLMHVSR